MLDNAFCMCYYIAKEREKEANKMFKQLWKDYIEAVMAIEEDRVNGMF